MSSLEKTENSFQSKLEKTFPLLLKVIKDLVPLAALGSLCVAIASFTRQDYPDASPWAISAATMFLTAFLVTFLYKLTKDYMYLLVTYISSFLAVIFFIPIIIVFTINISIINISYYLIYNSIQIIFGVTLTYNIFIRINKNSMNIIDSFYIIDVVISTAWIISLMINSYNRLFPNPILNIFSNISIVLLGIFFLTAILTVIIDKITKSKKK